MQKFRWSGFGFWLLLLILPFAEARCGDIAVTSRATRQAMTIDGLRSDWPAGAIGFLKEPEASVGVCNDSHNLYVVLAFRNQQWAGLIRMNGLTLWLDNQGKKKKQFKLKFTCGPGHEQMGAGHGPGSEEMPGQNPPEGIDQRSFNGDKRTETTLVCFEKDRISEKQIPLNGGEGPAGAFAVDEGFYVYEFKVPLHESTVRDYGIAPAADKPISIGFIWGEMDKSKMQHPQGGAEMGGMPGGGFGGGPGGSPGGGGPGRGGPMGGRSMPEKQEVWLKAKLVTVDSDTSGAKIEK